MPSYRDAPRFSGLPLPRNARNLFKVERPAPPLDPRGRLKALASVFNVAFLAVLAAGPGAPRAAAESGYQLWLRYPPVADTAKRDEYRRAFAALVVEGRSSTSRVVRE